MSSRYRHSVLVLLLVLVTSSSCSNNDSHDLLLQDQIPQLSPVVLEDGERLRVVATTSIVADVVKVIGGDRIELTQLLPMGADPHSFEPTPQDIAAVSNAHVIFVNGAGLEIFLEDLLAGVVDSAAYVPVSTGVDLITLENKDEHEHSPGLDPHTWLDPLNVIIWAQNVEQSLSALDPAGAEVYSSNALEITTELQALHTWIEDQVSLVPETNRRLVTDHAVFGYFARRYGFEQVGTVLPGFSTLAEPSAREFAELESTITEQGVQAIFVGYTINPDLAHTVAEDTGVEIVFLYTGSLSEPEGPASSYLSMMEYNTSMIVGALK